jgi:Fe-S cluster assembly protein SufD
MTTLTELRQSARQLAEGLPAPDRAQHLWRYTDPHLLRPGPLAVPGPTPWEVSPPPAGVLVQDLLDAVHEHHLLVQPHLAHLAVPGSSRWVAENTAGWEHGLLVHVGREQRVEGPVHLRLQGPDTEHAVGYPRLLVILEPGARLTLVEEQTGQPARHTQAHTVVEVVLGAGARLDHVLLQGWGPAVTETRACHTRIHQGAALQSWTVALGGRLTKTHTRALLAGRDAQARLVGLVLGQARQHRDHHTEVHHLAPGTRSHLEHRGALTDHAASACTARVRIEGHATDAETSQEFRTLLLSPEARAWAIPELEILTDQVSARHGVAVGPIDPEQVLYCRSRGLPEAQARRLVVEGFLGATLAELPESLRPVVLQALAGKLDHMLPGGVQEVP